MENKLTNRHKTFHITSYYRGIELDVICVTTSKKKFAELLDKPISYINNYASSYDLRYPVCNENADVLFAQVGLGGEGTYIFKRDDIKTYDEFKSLIDDHRKTYFTYRDYLEKNNLK